MQTGLCVCGSGGLRNEATTRAEQSFVISAFAKWGAKRKRLPIPSYAPSIICGLVKVPATWGSLFVRNTISAGFHQI